VLRSRTDVDVDVDVNPALAASMLPSSSSYSSSWGTQREHTAPRSSTTHRGPPDTCRQSAPAPRSPSSAPRGTLRRHSKAEGSRGTDTPEPAERAPGATSKASVTRANARHACSNRTHGTGRERDILGGKPPPPASSDPIYGRRAHGPTGPRVDVRRSTVDGRRSTVDWAGPFRSNREMVQETLVCIRVVMFLQNTTV